MSTNNDKNINILSLTDCLYFTNGFCMFKNKCHYRHCRTALKQLEKCPNWPDSCRNMDCPYRHTGMLSKISKPVPQEKALVSFFWNIENVPIPQGQKPFDIVQRIRQKLVIESSLQEAEFSCYCNINTISQENQQSLHHANVRIVHVPDRKLGAVDRQIMLELDRFGRTHRSPAIVVLISDCINFIGKLNSLRYQSGFHVIVIHNKPAEEELKAIVNADYSWELFTESLQPIMAHNSERLTNQLANVRPVLHDQLNNVSKVNRLELRKLMELPLRLIPYSQNENDLRQNDVVQSKPLATHRRSRSVHRNRHPIDSTQPGKPLIPQSINQATTLNAESNTPPSASTLIVAPRARIRQSSSISHLHRQNISMLGSCEQIPSKINDDTAKKQRNPLPCPYCTNEFNTILALRQHQKDKKHLFYCPVCKEGFPTSGGLNQHQAAKGHNVSKHTLDQDNLQLDLNQLAANSEHNLIMSNNTDWLPVYQSSTANYSIIDQNINNVSYLKNGED